LVNEKDMFLGGLAATQSDSRNCFR